MLLHAPPSLQMETGGGGRKRRGGGGGGKQAFLGGSSVPGPAVQERRPRWFSTLPPPHQGLFADVWERAREALGLDLEAARQSSAGRERRGKEPGPQLRQPGASRHLQAANRNTMANTGGGVLSSPASPRC